MEAIKKYMRAVSLINEWIGRIDSFVIVPLVLITVYEVALRKFFGSPTIWVFETSNQLYALFFMIGLGYALLHGSHVNIDIFYRFFSPRGKAIMDIFGFVCFFFPFCIVIAWKGTLFAAQSWAMLERSQSVLQIPLYPIKTIIPLMAITLGLQGTVIFIQKLYMVFAGKELKA
jgi:TRAP-type mannitol/chloroaromatic compound transport system permease small subunit